MEPSVIKSMSELKNMEFVPLSDMTLRSLALDDLVLKRVFHGVHPLDGLPSRPPRTT